MRHVCWKSHSEFCQVYNDLYSDVQLNQVNGLNLINVWRQRGTIPVSIEATAELLQAKLIEKENIEQFSEDYARQSMALAVVRFVNCVVDPKQTGQYALSVVNVAETLGLPRSIVDVRHAATHGQLPSLFVLQVVCCHCLLWLKDNFWEPQVNALVAAQSECIKLLETYISSSIRSKDVSKAMLYDFEKIVNFIQQENGGIPVVVMSLIKSRCQIDSMKPLLVNLIQKYQLKFYLEALSFVVSLPSRDETMVERALQLIETMMDVINTLALSESISGITNDTIKLLFGSPSEKLRDCAKRIVNRYSSNLSNDICCPIRHEFTAFDKQGTCDVDVVDSSQVIRQLDELKSYLTSKFGSSKMENNPSMIWKKSVYNWETIPLGEFP